jgi:hypothetical protein
LLVDVAGPRNSGNCEARHISWRERPSRRPHSRARGSQSAANSDTAAPGSWSVHRRQWSIAAARPLSYGCGPLGRDRCLRTHAGSAGCGFEPTGTIQSSARLRVSAASRFPAGVRLSTWIAAALAMCRLSPLSSSRCDLLMQRDSSQGVFRLISAQGDRYAKSPCSDYFVRPARP